MRDITLPAIRSHRPSACRQPVVLLMESSIPSSRDTASSDAPSRPGARRWLVLALVSFLVPLIAIGGFLVVYELQQPAWKRHKPAPEFALQDQSARTHRLSDYLGRAVVLAFFPGDDEKSVTALRSLRSAARELDMHGVKVFAVSSQQAGPAGELYRREQLTFPVLADANGMVARAYGVTSDEGRAGLATVIVTPSGTIGYTLRNVDPKAHADQVLPLVQCCMDEFAPRGSKALGQPLPNFSLPNVVTGAQETLFGTESPRATVVVFLSAECPCSQGYDARLRSLADTYGSRGVRFVAVNACHGETLDEARQHARRAGFPFPVFRDATQTVAGRLGARVTPEVFVADRQGVVRYHGRIDDSRDPEGVQSRDLQATLDALLQGQDPPQAETRAFGCAIPRPAS